MNKNNQEQEENFMTRQEVLMTFAQGAKKILENNFISFNLQNRTRSTKRNP